jgi:hypothetical protein
MSKEFNLRGRKWICTENPLSGYWSATSENPHCVLTAPSWREIKDVILAFDPNTPRVDAVAVCDPLPPMGAKAAF